MKQVTVNVPEKKIEFFMELLNSLGFTQTDEIIDIPEAHKELVRNRIKNATPNDYQDWDKVKGKI